MSNYYLQYTQLDEKIDKYLGTNNLRPGPPRKLINQKILGFNDITSYKTKIEFEQKTKIKFNSNSMEIDKINWSE